MKNTFRKLIPLLLCLVLLLSLVPAARAEEEPSIIDEEALDAWITEYVRVHDLSGGGQTFSVGFCYTATGDCWYYNADVFMYAASMYKVPVSMILAEKEAAGELSQESMLGGYTLKYLESKALTFSDNTAGHAMLDYLGEDNSGKASRLCMQYSSLSESYFDPDFFDYSYYSTRFITQVMLTLYEGGDERFPHIIENLLVAQPDSYLNLRLMGKYDVAQKYGAFEERNGNYNNHITAIVYTPTPVIITVMTRNVGNFMPLMAEVGEYLADYSLELDEKYAQREAERAAQAAAAPPEPEEGAPELQDTPQDVAVRPAPAHEGSHAGQMFAFYVMWAAILALGALIVIHGLRYRRQKAAAGRH